MHSLNGSTQEPRLGRRVRRALSSAWKSTWFATKGPGVQIPQRPPPSRGSKPLSFRTHEDSPIQWVAYITPIRLNSLQTITMQIMLIRIPTGPFFTFDEGFMLIRNIPTLCDFLYDIYIYNGTL